MKQGVKTSKAAKTLSLQVLRIIVSDVNLNAIPHINKTFVHR